MQTQTTLAHDDRASHPSDVLRPMSPTRRWERLGAAAGIVFVALQLALGGVLGAAPALDAGPTEIQSYLVDDGGDILLAATLGTLSVFFFIWFLGTVRTFVQHAEGAPGTLGTVAYGAGLVTITLATTASLPGVALAWNDTAALADPGLLRAVWNLNTLALVPIGASAAAFSLAVALVILRTRVIPT